MKTMMALYKYAKIREVQLTLEVAITDMEGEPKSDASTIEEQCAGVVEERVLCPDPKPVQPSIVNRLL